MDKLENKMKARCQVGNKAMETKLANTLRGNERKKRKDRYAKLNRGRWLTARLTARGKEW